MLCSLLLTLSQVAGVDADLAAAREVFDRNIRAIQERDQAGYLSCYHESDRLVRTGPDGFQLGYSDLASGAPQSGSNDWPDELIARDLQLTWIADGVVYGTYRYRSDFAGVLSNGISERLFRETESGWKIVVTTAFEASSQTAPAPLALVGAVVHDGLGGQPIADAVVVTRDGRIEAFGPRGETAIPDDAETIDLSGRYICPGLIDSHVHYSQTGWADGRPDAYDVRSDYPYAAAMTALELHPERIHRAFLASGVTAVLDAGGFPWTRRLGRTTELSDQAPHVVAAGALLATWVPDFGMVDQSQFVLISDEATVRDAVREHASSGSAAIKVWFIVREPEDVERQTPLLHAAGAEARAQGLPLIVHATQLEAARVAIEAGASLLVHSVEDAPVDDDFVSLALEHDVSYCPTLTVFDGYRMLASAKLSEPLRASLAFVHPSVAERVLATESLEPRPARLRDAWRALGERQSATMRKNLARLHSAGVRIVFGTDAGNPLTLHGPSVHPELAAMQDAGLAPLAVLRSATADAAVALSRASDLGRIAPGFIADLLVLEEDPASDVGALRKLTHVMRAGRLQKRERLIPR